MTHHHRVTDPNDAQSHIYADTCIHYMFEAQVARTPDAIAAVFEDQYVTYADLNRRANQLAWYLQTLGVGPDVRVGLCLERSLNMLVGMLGILKAGAAYVPLDPLLPPDRLAFMFADAQAAVLVTQQRLRLALPIQGIATVQLDGAWPIGRQEHDDLPARDATSRHLVYVLFTSGSTGRPKGVAVEHRQLCNYLHGIVEQLDLPAGAGFALVSTFAADLGNTVIFPSLCTGGCLHVVSHKRASDPDLLSDYFSRQRIDCLKIVPSHLLALLSAAHPEQVVPRSLLVLGGEAAPRQLIERLQQLAPGCRILNHYGPTETTVGVLTYSVSCIRADESGATLPLGYPLANTQIYLLGSDLRPVPAGEPGELYIGGAGLARGYLGRPNLTAERFIPNPFIEDKETSRQGDKATEDRRSKIEDRGSTIFHPPSSILHPRGERLYRTGDLARCLPCGAIMFLGRVDQQVKIRGFRIELGEVEAVLRQHPAVQTAVVLAREDVPGDTRLVAYLVTSDKLQVTSKEDSSLVTRHSLLVTQLRTFLQARLPEYMQPTAFVLLNSLPLTSNGKLDRRALPAPERTRANLDTAFVAPRTPVEELLAGTWTELLGCAEIGIDDNFFELGGHSLLAAQAVARLRTAFQAELPLRSFFDTPTVRGLAEAVIAHTPTPGAQGYTTTKPHTIPARTETAALWPSFAQQRLWFLDQLAPGSAFYNIPIAIRLTGSLNYAALAHSLNTIVQRHEALRTTFSVCGGQPVQVIAPTLALALVLLDLQALPSAARDPAARHLATGAVQRPFDLARGPLLRATLVRLDAAEHLLVLTLHHIISDGWSTEVLFRELGQLYTAAVTAQVQPLTPLPIQYADYALWQRTLLQGVLLERQLGYWRRQLKGVPALLELPTDRPRPSVQTFHGAWHPLALPPGLRTALLGLSRREGVTLFMTLLAAFQILLARYSGQDDIVVGAPIAGRTHAEIEGLIGFFANTLALRTDVSGNPTFRALLERVREVCLGAYAHQDLPFEKLVEELHPQRTLSFNPLFQASLALQNDPLYAPQLHDLTSERLELDSGRARFDVALLLQNRADGLVGMLEYSTDLFDAATIARMAGHFQRLLEGIVADVDTQIAALPLLSGAERQDLLITWNATRANIPTDICIQQLVEAQVARTTDAVALIFDRSPTTDQRGDTETRRHGDTEIGHLAETSHPSPIPARPLRYACPPSPNTQHLTYQELNERANQLAHYLRARGVGPDVPVGICMERSLELVIGLLGVLKAGGAYVPIDPAYPEERLTFILRDARAPILLTQARLAEWLRVYRGKIVRLDTNWPMISDASRANPAQATAPEQLAYVIYTSGSTGWPKGVQIGHGSLVNLVCWHQHAFALTPVDRTSLVAGLGFDATAWELWPTLASGASLHIVSEDLRAAPEQIRDWLINQAITISFLPTPMAERVIMLEWPAAVALRTLLTGGDTLRHTPPAALPFVLVNNYGPTENTVVTTSGLVPHSSAGSAAPSIGRPIANSQVYLMNTYMQPVPVGVAGELYIGGAGLARGYLGRPDLTAERFIPNPFVGDKETSRQGDKETEDRRPKIFHPPSSILHPRGERLYRTGDLARYRPNGSIEFLGRVDHQVKIRGFRIELGEIEAVLRQHSGVRDAVLVAREADELATPQSQEQNAQSVEHENAQAALAKGAKTLVAYVVPTREQGTGNREGTGRDTASLSPVTYHLSPQELRGFLREKLPDYMIPSAFVLLQELPLTANGKVDRRALPAPDTSRPDLGVTFVAPRTPVEEVLVQIWIDILGCEQIGINDNFFALGGHSLLVTRVIVEIHDVLEVELPLRSLFEAPTVAELATMVLQTSESWVRVERTAQLLLWQIQLSEDEMETQVAQEKLLYLEA